MKLHDSASRQRRGPLCSQAFSATLSRRRRLKSAHETQMIGSQTVPLLRAQISEPWKHALRDLFRQDGHCGFGFCRPNECKRDGEEPSVSGSAAAVRFGTYSLTSPHSFCHSDVGPCMKNDKGTPYMDEWCILQWANRTKMLYFSLLIAFT
jgi:hypothetical protein